MKASLASVVAVLVLVVAAAPAIAEDGKTTKGDAIAAIGGLSTAAVGGAGAYSDRQDVHYLRADLFDVEERIKMINRAYPNNPLMDEAATRNSSRLLKGQLEEKARLLRKLKVRKVRGTVAGVAAAIGTGLLVGEGATSLTLFQGRPDSEVSTEVSKLRREAAGVDTSVVPNNAGSIN